MSAQCPPRRAPRPARQRGQAMMLTVLLVAVSASAVVYNFVAPAKQTIRQEQITAAALAQAKDALVGRAAADQVRPGSLPCPDIDNDGDAESPVASGGVCPRYIGRFPWRTLGTPELRDGSGERLWYVLTPAFRDHPTGGALNSDTPGQLTITGTAPATNVIAILFAPGAVLGTQDRSGTTSSLCATTGTNMLRSLCAENYLDGENSNGAPPTDITFTTALASVTFNDRLLPITRETLFPLIELRVARELRLSLRSYYTTNQYYPHAAQLTGTAWVDGLYRGRVPTDTCPSVAGLTLPAWFVANNWHQVVIYAVAPRCTPRLTPTGGFLACAATCTGFSAGQCPAYTIGVAEQNCNNAAAGPLLTIDGSATYQAAILPAGYGIASQTRPCAIIADCLETVGGNNENIDIDNYAYVKPVRSSANNDNLIIVGP